MVGSELNERLSNLTIEDLGCLGYEDAYAIQEARVDAVLARRAGMENPTQCTDPPAKTSGVQKHGDAETGCKHDIWGHVLLVEHHPVITISGRKGAGDHLLASEATLARMGVALARTNRGGDITYHGPGQLVVYPILDLNRLMLRLHDYMRLLEQVVIDTIADFGITGRRDPDATGVWVEVAGPDASVQLAKIAAMGVRVRRWVSMHGLALNITTNLEHFKLIVPCGLAGRPVTSMQACLGEQCPDMELVKVRLIDHLHHHLAEARACALAHREGSMP